MRKRVFNILTKPLLTALCLSALVGCSSVVDDENEVVGVPSNTSTFINLTIGISNGRDVDTRAGEVPAAGENGDGREAGFLRENAVTGITLILYQDNNGINGADATTLDFVNYYTVSRVGDPLPANGTDLGKSKVIEAYYTTGNQPLRKSDVDFTKSYHAIVVANADLRGMVNTLGDVKNYKLNSLYSGTEMSAASECSGFVMSSEQDYTMNFATTTPTDYSGGLLYTFTNLIIERMAARIDFWSACSNGYKTSADNAAYTTPGYEYTVEGGTDKFVVTGITPFNLNAGNVTNGGEYLIKRLADEIKETPTITYLADESGTNYVLDPATRTKVDGELTYMKNRLASFGDLSTLTTLTANGYYKSVASLHSAVTASGSTAGYPTYTEGTLKGENVIITYPMENTLWGASRLFNFATGIAVEGDYYTNGAGTPQHRIYYGYMRHQGTSSSSYTAKLGADMSTTEASTSANCMEFGIVRNNIYRVYISRIGKTEGDITIHIKVKKWDIFEHAPIYM